MLLWHSSMIVLNWNWCSHGWLSFGSSAFLLLDAAYGLGWIELLYLWQVYFEHLKLLLVFSVWWWFKVFWLVPVCLNDSEYVVFLSWFMLLEVIFPVICSLLSLLFVFWIVFIVYALSLGIVHGHMPLSLSMLVRDVS